MIRNSGKYSFLCVVINIRSRSSSSSSAHAPQKQTHSCRAERRCCSLFFRIVSHRAVDVVAFAHTKRKLKWSSVNLINIIERWCVLLASMNGTHRAISIATKIVIKKRKRLFDCKSAVVAAVCVHVLPFAGELALRKVFWAELSIKIQA